jgi:hypothetical protein
MSVTFNRVSHTVPTQSMANMQSVRTPQRVQRSTSTPTPSTHIQASQRSVNPQAVAARKQLESKDVIASRINLSLQKLEKNGIDIQVSAPTKTSKFVSALKAVAKTFTGLFSKATNLVIGALKLTLNLVPVTICGLISIGQKLMPGYKPGNDEYLIEKYLKAAQPMNEAFDGAMNTVTKFFAGEYFGKPTGQDEALLSTEIAADTGHSMVHEGLGQAADNLGMNFTGTAKAPDIGEVGNQGELAMQLGMTTAVAGGLEGGQTILQGVNDLVVGGQTRSIGKTKLREAGELNEKINQQKRILELRQLDSTLDTKISGRTPDGLELEADLEHTSILQMAVHIQDSTLTTPLTRENVIDEIKRLEDLPLLNDNEESQLISLTNYLDLGVQKEYAELMESQTTPVNDLSIKKLEIQAKRLEGAGQVLKQAGDNQQTQAGIDIGRGTVDIAMSVNGVVNLMVGSDSATHLIASNESAQFVAGTATQIVGAGVMVITKGVECGLDIKRSINASANVERAHSFVDNASSNVNSMEDEMVVAAVKQFEKKQASSGFLSKVKAVLNGALAVAGVAVIVATCIVGAATPVGWAVGGAALLIGAGMAIHQAYKAQRETDNISSLESARGKMQTQMTEMIESYQSKTPPVDLNAEVSGATLDQLNSEVNFNETMLGDVDGIPASELTRSQIAEKLRDPTTPASLKTDLEELQFSRDKQSLLSLQNISDEIDLALCSISPKHATDTLAEMILSDSKQLSEYDPSSGDPPPVSSSSAKMARDAMRTVFRISPTVFQVNPENPSEPMDVDAFKKGREVLNNKLSLFYTNVFDDSILTAQGR